MWGGVYDMLGDPENRPQTVGSQYDKDPKKVPLISETPMLSQTGTGSGSSSNNVLLRNGKKQKQTKDATFSPEIVV